MAAGALGTAGAVGGVVAVQPRKDRCAPFATGTKRGVSDRPEHERRVLIVGGGLAGMSAASVLAQRGYDVRLYEAASELGGKLAGWPIQVLGETVPMEHGFHGFFRQYYNLRELLGQAGALEALQPQAAYTVLFADGREEPFGAGVLPYPLDLLEVLATSPSLSLSDVAGDRPGMRALLSYDPTQTVAQWDGVDAVTFVREGQLQGAFADLILEPFGQASMNALSGFSAAELIRFFHFYMLGNPEGLGFDVLTRGVHEAILGPLRQHLERLGVQILTGTPVQQVRLSADGVSVRIGVEGHEEQVAVASVPQRGWGAFPGGFVRRVAEGFEAKSSRCTHMGCPVALVREGFVCPCHAGRYDLDGAVVSGPPPAGLSQMQVVQQGETLVITAPRALEDISGSAVVLALDTPSLKRLGAASDFKTQVPKLWEQLQAMDVAEPYAVVRFWFDQPTRADRTPFYTVAGYPWTDSLAIYSAFQEPYVEWASRTGGSVVESHAYAIPQGLQGDVDVYREALLAELRVAFPELATATVLHVEAMTQSNFTRFAPGDAARRPGVRTEHARLHLAGDNVALPFPAFLMEAAVASGKLAANAICARDGVVEAEVPTVALVGTLSGWL
jgi:carotenoid phi-ring synthase / carotenoid chi-ring synthase